MLLWRLIFAAFLLSSLAQGMEEFKKNISNSFDELGVSYDTKIIEKCLEICKKYNVEDAEEFVDTWMAYSVSKLQGENPTLANLSKFEREEYIKKLKENKKTLEILNSSSSTPTIYGGLNVRENEAANILMAYNETTPKAKTKYTQDGQVAGGSGIKRKYNYDSSPQVTFSPASYSPTITTPSAKYLSRTNAGEVVFRMNDAEESKNVWKCQDNYFAKIELAFNYNSETIYYMHNSLTDFLDYWDRNIKKIGKLICEKYLLEEEMPMDHKSVTPFIIVGRIACDGEGKLNCKSVLLEGASDNASGVAVDLDLSVLKKYSVFPGEVVAAEVYNLTKEKLVVKELYTSTVPEFFKPLALPRGSLNVIVAAGPFTPSDSLTYQPLLDLVEEVTRIDPHLLILAGPFIDSNHPMILKNIMAETADDFFVKIIEQIMKPLERKKTQVIIINSYKEFTSPMVYPTPQIKLKTKQNFPRLHLLPDPSIFGAEDVVFGVTSTDVLLHLSREEISCSQEYGRLPRLAKHILEQRSFYPLAPSREVPLDPTLMEFAKLDVAPHVLILPSDLRYFIKEVSGCVVVNPERLAKGLIGGTYARLIISPNKVRGNIVRI